MRGQIGVIRNLMHFKNTMKNVQMIQCRQYERFIRNAIEKANATNCRENSADLSYLLRNFKEDITEPISGTIKGNIPKWLTGTLIRNGPGQQSFGNYSYKHLFDGAAALHRIHFKDGSATYQCKLLKSETYLKNSAAQRIVVSEFGTRAIPDPCQTIFQRFVSCFKLEDGTDNCLVSVYPFKNEVYVLTETPFMYRIDPNNIDTKERVNILQLANIFVQASHPHVEENGLVSNIGLSMQSNGPAYSVFEFPRTQIKNSGQSYQDVLSEPRIVGKVKCRWPLHPSYMHSFGVTENYYIIIEQPYSISFPSRIIANFNNKPLYKIMKWYENYPTLIHVVSRKNGEVIESFLAEPFLFFHTINQYEEDNHIVIDVCAYKDPSIIECMMVEALKNAEQNPDFAKLFRSRPVRFVLPIKKSGSKNENLVQIKNTEARAYYSIQEGKTFVVPEILAEVGCEMPRFNCPKFLGKKYRYFYAISADYDNTNSGKLIKVDAQTKTYKTWGEAGMYANEPIFVPAPEQKAEDEGVIVSTILWNDEKKMTAVILDGLTFTELGRIDFKSPGPVPNSLHGWFFPSF